MTTIRAEFKISAEGEDGNATDLFDGTSINMTDMIFDAHTRMKMAGI